MITETEADGAGKDSSQHQGCFFLLLGRKESDIGGLYTHRKLPENKLYYEYIFFCSNEDGEPLEANHIPASSQNPVASLGLS